MFEITAGHGAPEVFFSDTKNDGFWMYVVRPNLLLGGGINGVLPLVADRALAAKIGRVFLSFAQHGDLSHATEALEDVPAEEVQRDVRDVLDDVLAMATGHEERIVELATALKAIAERLRHLESSESKRIYPNWTNAGAR